MEKMMEKIMRDAMSGAAGHAGGMSGRMETVLEDVARRSPRMLKALASLNSTIDSLPKKGEMKSKFFMPSSFLNRTGIKRFSMCFNDEGRDGALTLGTPKATDALTSVGAVHWSLDFQGISLGKTAAPASVKFCTPSSKKEGQTTACAAIPDSGTTLVMAPEKQLKTLFEEICDSWDRCREATSTGLQKKKGEIFMMLLSQCSEWLTNSTGLGELPDLHFHLGGANGKKKTLSLDGVSYVIETMQDEVEIIKKRNYGLTFGGAKVDRKEEEGVRSRLQRDGDGDRGERSCLDSWCASFFQVQCGLRA